MLLFPVVPIGKLGVAPIKKYNRIARVNLAIVLPVNRIAQSHRLAVCSWSLQPADARQLAAKLGDTGVHRVQLALDPLHENPAGWNGVAEILRAAGISIISGMVGCAGEDYSTLQTIRVTGGIAPDATWDENRKKFSVAAARAAEMELKLVTLHAGFLPHDEADPAFAKMLERLKIVSDIFAAKNIAVGLETGQETAADLAAMLTRLARPNVGVNFDPANMILYDKGDPVAALHVLAPWIRQVHIKDAIRTTVPGAWGEEVVAGTGQVNWPGFFAALAAINFAGDYVIEREAGEQRVADVGAARELFLNLNHLIA
jgi:sugar phosphate isomerase/epimerase